jgi:glucan biosynthesis protein C
MAEFGGGSLAPERLHALDAVRGFALLLGIVYQATFSFVPTPSRFWIIRDTHPSITLALLFGVAFSCDPTWLNSLGVPTPDQSLVTNLQAMVGFGTAFGVGWLLHRQIDLIRILERRWLLNLVVAIALITASLALAGLPPKPFSDNMTRLAGCACYALAIWTTTFAVIGVALRFLSGFSAARRYLADSSYWLYLIHLPIVTALQVAVSQLDWPWPAKFATILVVARRSC